MFFKFKKKFVVQVAINIFCCVPKVRFFLRIAISKSNKKFESKFGESNDAIQKSTIKINISKCYIMQFCQYWEKLNAYPPILNYTSKNSYKVKKFCFL